MKKLLNIVGYLLIVLLVLFFIVGMILWLVSPGIPDKVWNTNGKQVKSAISVIEKIPINGIDQYLVIRGENAEKPVLLFLHGGPGSPEFPLMKNKGLNLEKEFVVAYWQQRGAGKSYSDAIPAASMTIPQLVADGAAVATFLRTRFKQEKIHLIGHSWGSFLGTLLVHQHPSHFYSYIGVGQVAHQYEGEKLSFEWVKAQAKAANNQADLSSLEALTFPDSLDAPKIWSDFLAIEREMVNKYGGGLQREAVSMMEVYKTYIFDTPEYTIQDKLNLLKGMEFSIQHLWDDVLQTNFLTSIDSIAIPVHIIQGVHDYQTPYVPAKMFFDQLKAPEKYFYTFENSAHSPFLDEREKFNAIITSLPK